MARGKLIVIEGLDRTGKSTQCDLLVSKLQPNVELIKFPDRTTQIGGLIDRYLKDSSFTLPNHSIHMLFSANRWELFKLMREKLLQGINLVVDRYVYSGVAYSSAKRVPGMDLSWCFGVERGLLKPDLVIFLVNKHSNAGRKGFGEERYENVAFQEAVEEKFLEMFSLLGEGVSVTGPPQIIDVTDKGISEVEKDIWQVVSPVVNNEGDDDEDDDLQYILEAL